MQRISTLARHCSLPATLPRHLVTSSTTSASSTNKKPLCVIVGAGDGIGKALARRFAEGGYTLVLVRRTREPLVPVVDDLIKASGSTHYAYGLDARKEDDVKRLFDVEIAPLLSPEGGHELRVVIHNIGGNVQFSLQDTTERVYRKVWELCSLSAFLVGREASRVMLSRNADTTNKGKGCIIFTGATASIRGKEGYAAFSAGMQSKRALAQSMAREYHPKGLHVASVIIDGAVDTAKVEARFTKASSSSTLFEAMREAKRVLEPDSIAGTFFHLANDQTVDAWTHELDLRPYAEVF